METSESFCFGILLAAIYSSPQDIGNQLAEVILQQGDAPEIDWDIRYPKYFSISVNPHVARSLSIQIPEDSQTIRTLIMDAEK